MTAQSEPSNSRFPGTTRGSSSPGFLEPKIPQQESETQSENGMTKCNVARVNRLSKPRVEYTRGIDQNRIPSPYSDAGGRCCGGLSSWPLVFAGNVGVGKTRAMNWYAGHAAGHLFWRAFGHMVQEAADAKRGTLRWPTVGGTGEEYWSEIDSREFWTWLDDCALVAIDDIGRRHSESQHAYDTLIELLDRREGKPLIMTTNLTLAQIAEIFDDRVADRLGAGTYVWHAGESQR